MNRFTLKLRALLAAFVICLGAATLGAPNALAQSAPPAAPAAAHEEVLFRYLQTQGSGNLVGRVTIPDQKAATLIQPRGREFQDIWRGPMKWIAAASIIGMIVLVGIFYAVKGPIRTTSGYAGRLIQRFRSIDVFAHWLTAGSFVLLAITGLNITFGRYLLLPLIGPEAFTAWSEAAKVAHNFLGFPFTLGVLLMFVLFLKDNIFDKTDLRWFAQGGGMIGHAHPPARKFNGGQKIVYWATVFGGGALAVTGFVLMFPFQIVTSIDGMQLTAQLHGIIAFLMIALIIGHIYLGSIGMEGAFSAMWSGKVDLNWAKEHHPLWVEEMMNPTRKDSSLPTGAKGAGAD